MNVTEAYVDSLALNSGAIKNGRDLAKKNSFTLLGISEDQTVLFGECQGSGKEPYRCSADFVKEESPVFRCSCPSRQFPCKHVLGLLYSRTTGKTFGVAAIPPDLLEKREKAEKREEKKKEAAETETPVKRKTNKAAAAKKAAAQLEGIGIAEKLLHHIVQSGLGSLDKKSLQTAEEQAKQLGNHYIPGIQTTLRELLLVLRSEDDRTAVYARAVEGMINLHSLLKKSREHLQIRADQPDTPLDTETPLEERIGHAFQIAELRDSGLAEGETELLQLAFRSYADEARGEYIDEGFWADLPTGRIHTTKTYRPFRAAKYIREDDSFYEVIRAKELFRYPGDRNARVRWEEATMREAEAGDYSRVRSYAVKSVADAVKQVKNQMKNPLSDKHPVLLLHAASIGRTDDGLYALLDESGNRLLLTDIDCLGHPTVPLLPMLNERWLKDQAYLVMFEHDMALGRLAAQPLSIVTDDAVIRLLY
ncbi:SWIM zinc finger family protein [Paenibacillus ginsengarvi]|uniref:SWIM zinc finger family protein n=1 Tax=Paenibacillus ginsengarvi TaxID=400777 RepID=A0A3B0BRP5_9BACL|nr:SWIM zinc finger family protein [Paenibacillus ginsengarvi]RKN75963.1 SWIM zinc finger family protein [Paenibacillus ginsengarvi]